MDTIRSLMDPDVAAWVQALGSIFAIVVSIYAVNHAHRLNIDAEKKRDAENRKQQFDNLLFLISHVNKNLHALSDDPDDKHALARYWHDNSNNSVPIQLAQIQYDLDKLMMIHPLDTPDFQYVQGLVYSLIVVKGALELENKGEPIQAAGRERISIAAWNTKKYWAKESIRIAAIVRARKEQGES
jgi:hypothetical protein